MIMDKKTQLSISIPGFVEDWNAYKKGLKEIKGLKITDWCIFSDYCFNDTNKEDAATFTIFPYSCAHKIIREIETNVPADIKKMTYIPENCINFLKNSPYFFHITIVIEKLKNVFQEKDVLQQLENTFKEYELSDIDKLSQDIKQKHKVLKSLYEYIKQKSHSKKLLSQIYFVSQFVSQLLEFLLIKEKGRNPHWCSDRDGITTKCDGILFYLVNFGLARLLRGRISDFWLHLPAEIKENNSKYPYDNVIRVPDIITGIVSSMKYTNKGIQMDKPKHLSLFQELIPDNPRIITLEYIYKNDGKGYLQRVFWAKPISDYDYKPLQIVTV